VLESIAGRLTSENEGKVLAVETLEFNRDRGAGFACRMRRLVVTVSIVADPSNPSRSRRYGEFVSNREGAPQNRLSGEHESRRRFAPRTLRVPGDTIHRDLLHPGVRRKRPDVQSKSYPGK
jgi:hypothetical protein